MPSCLLNTPHAAVTRARLSVLAAHMQAAPTGCLLPLTSMFHALECVQALELQLHSEVAARQEAEQRFAATAAAAAQAAEERAGAAEKRMQQQLAAQAAALQHRAAEEQQQAVAAAEQRLADIAAAHAAELQTAKVGRGGIQGAWCAPQFGRVALLNPRR